MSLSLPCFCRSVAADAQLSREWCSKGNGGVLPEAVALKSNKKYVWRCLCNPIHPAYQATPQKRSVGGTGCPECAKEARRSQMKRGSLIEEHPELAAQWDHELKVRALQTVTSGSQYKAFWICPESTCHHLHRWKAKVCNRTGRGTGCPFCSGLVCCPCNSVAGKVPELLREWNWAINHTLGLDPYKISPGSQKTAWWHIAKKGSWQQVVKQKVHIAVHARLKVWDPLML